MTFNILISENVSCANVVAGAAASVLLDLNLTDELIDGLGVDCVLEAELVGEESGVRDCVGGLRGVD